MNRNYKRNLIIALIAITMMMPISVSAQNTDQGNGSGNAGTTSGSENAAQGKLSGNSLEKCQSRERVMNNIMTRIGDRGQKQIEVINSIQQKVQNFYSEKNISLDSYNMLMEKVEAKKQVATTAMNNVRVMNGSFSCSGENPKGVATQFKSQASVQSAAVGDYRDAVHELAVAIKTALGDSQTAEEN